jgi:hypothetical protein
MAAVAAEAVLGSLHMHGEYSSKHLTRKSATSSQAVPRALRPKHKKQTFIWFAYRDLTCNRGQVQMNTDNGK